MRASSTPWLSTRTYVVPTQASASFRFATLTGVTGARTSATCPAPVCPLPPFHTGALGTMALSLEFCLPNGQSVQVWSREEEGWQGLGGAKFKVGPQEAACCTVGYTGRKGGGEPGTEAWVGAMGTHIQMGGESPGKLQGGGDEGADLRVHPLPKGEVDGSRWARFFPRLAATLFLKGIGSCHFDRQKRSLGGDGKGLTQGELGLPLLRGSTHLWSRGGGAQDSPHERLLSTYQVPEDRRMIPKLGVSWVEHRHQGGRRLRLLPLDGSSVVGLWRKATEGKAAEMERHVGQSWSKPRIWGAVQGR